MVINFDPVLATEIECVRVRLTAISCLFINDVAYSCGAILELNPIDDYRGMMAANIVGSSQFAFKAFLIQVANHDSADALPIQFIQHDKLSFEEKAEFERFAVMVKLKGVNVANAGLLKPAAVIKAVQKALGNPKIEKKDGKSD
uniref:Uncharacterized protein n=1 Tax=mine drainage metagenome TaxID=410659 RepID=E6QX19_9ZZZZ